VLVQKRCDLAEFVLAADERRRKRGKVAAATGDRRDGGDRGVVGEDRLLEPPQLGPRLEPELVGEYAPRLLERLECVGLAAAAIERQHELPPQPLPEGVVCERRPERRRELAMLPERKRDLELLLERIDAQSLEPAGLGAEPGCAGQTLQRRAAPEGQRRLDGVRRRSDVAVAQRGARLGDQLLEPERVDARVLQGVSIGKRGDRPIPERGTKPCDVVVERVPRSGRELLPPQAVDERVDVDDAAVPQREHREHRLTLRPAHVRRPPPATTSNGPRSRISSCSCICAATLL
jgi:hypothetical protein